MVLKSQCIVFRKDLYRAFSSTDVDEEENYLSLWEFSAVNNHFSSECFEDYTLNQSHQSINHMNQVTVLSSIQI